MYLEPSDESRPQALYHSDVPSWISVSIIDAQGNQSTEQMSRVVGAGAAKLIVFREIAYDTSANDLDVTCQYPQSIGKKPCSPWWIRYFDACSLLANGRIIIGHCRCLSAPVATNSCRAHRRQDVQEYSQSALQCLIPYSAR